MSDMLSRRMAYRNAARAAFYENESTTKEEAKKLEPVKVFHAHGFVVHSDNCASGEEIWRNNSSFSEVFFDFEKAKAYLLAKFEELLADIHNSDQMYEGLSEKDFHRDINKSSPYWRREYIEEYIFYNLIISEIRSDCADNKETDFTSPEKINWYFHCNGEVSTRDYVFGDKEYECRESDWLPEAGTKFKVGDLVEYTDWEYQRDYPEVYIVLATPDKPKDKKTPWVNEYELAGIEDGTYGRNAGLVVKETLHEADLKLSDTENLNEPLLVLQKVIKGDIEVLDKLKDDILNRCVLLNAIPSWRDFPELTKKD